MQLSETALEVNKTGSLHNKAKAPWYISLISFLTHPLFVPLFVLLALLYLHPTLFANFNAFMRSRLIAALVLNTIFFPGFVVFLLWRLKFAKNMLLEQPRDRVVPYITSIIFFFWAWYVFRGQAEIPRPMVQFLLGAFLTVSAGLMANSFFLVSMHGLAWGGASGFFIVQALRDGAAYGLPMIICLLIAGLTGTVRLAAKAHEPFEVYAGLAIGLVCQLMAALIYWT